ncbi:MAG TPA: ribonuclease P protein component [Gammaproteobacteria bacterium]|nr:ribonuclease P protein component [Gammaproteobacteria bacterium]
MLGCLPNASGSAAASRPAAFSSRQRLHNPREFGRVFADPVRSSDRFFTVLARANERGVARLGLTIARRVAKRAVDRNRLKRLARESFRTQRSLPAWDFVVLAKPGAGDGERGALRESLDRHFERLKAQISVGRDG